MPKRTRSFRSWQLEKLSNPKRAAGYLNAALQSSSESFLVALGKVAQANQMSKVAKEAGVQRESLYRCLSEDGNPTLETLCSVLGAVGLRLSIEELRPTDPVLMFSGPLMHIDMKPINLLITYPTTKQVFDKRPTNLFELYARTQGHEVVGSGLPIGKDTVGPLGVEIPAPVYLQNLHWSSK